MSQIPKILQGKQLEEFLTQLSSTLTARSFSAYSPDKQEHIRLHITEIIRYHLAGFSLNEILEEETFFFSILKDRAVDFYKSVIDAIGNVILSDPNTGEQELIPEVWDIRALFGLGQNSTVDQARMFAVMKPIKAFSEGDYDTCAISGGQGAAAFGRPLFYLMNIIGNFRLGRQQEAEDAGLAAVIGLEISPWHRALALLTLGKISPAEVVKFAQNDLMHLEFKCFEGLRAFTNDDKVNARRILSSAPVVSDSPVECLLIKADLDRCCKDENKIESRDQALEEKAEAAEGTPADLARDCEHHVAVKLLAEQPPHSQADSVAVREQSDSIHLAVQNGDLDKVRALLQRNGALVFSKGYEGATALHNAAFDGRKDVAALLISNKAEIDAKDDKGKTPLHKAVYSGVGMVSFLLENGADVMVRDNRGNTPLHEVSIEGEKPEVAEVLLANGADVNAMRNDGKTPLRLAADYEHSKDVAEFLRQHGGLEDGNMAAIRGILSTLARPEKPRQEATKEQPFINSLGMKFVPVPGTEVLFCIHATRKGDYRKFAEATPELDASWKRVGAGILGLVSEGEDYPVVKVSWEDAQRFCAWLSKMEGLKFRLPTDHEWSCAVGIGDQEDPTASPHEKSSEIEGVFPWGTQWPPPVGAGNFADMTLKKRGWTGEILEGYDDGYATTSPVMSFGANPFGLYDLAGNVEEWCEEQMDPPLFMGRVTRGESWRNSDRESLLSSHRFSLNGEFRFDNVGFRLVLER